MKYTPKWDLTTVPEPEWKSENGRRQRAKGPKQTYVNLQPCIKCGKSLTATQRRVPCPKCEWKNVRRVVRDGKMTDIPNEYVAESTEKRKTK
jgi:DNA-directed RNA polymerase subunit RPC12/RpoP